MLHPKTKRDYQRDLKNIRQSLNILNSISTVKVIMFSMLGGGYKCELSLGMLPLQKQNDIINYIEDILETHAGYLITSLNKEKGTEDEQQTSKSN